MLDPETALRDFYVRLQTRKQTGEEAESSGVTRRETSMDKPNLRREKRKLDDDYVAPLSTFCNTEQSCTATCPVGTTGDPKTATVPADTLCGYTSQATADAAAKSQACAEAAAMLVCVSSSERCCACGPIDLFWPDKLVPVGGESDNSGGPYPSGTGNGYWRQVCLRVFRYTRDTATGALSDRQVFRISVDFKLPDDVLTCDSYETLDPTTNWWNPTADQVSDMVSYVPPDEDCSGSDTGSMKVNIYVKFWRKYQRAVDADGHWQSGANPDWLPVGDETTSLPLVAQLCWKYIE